MPRLPPHAVPRCAWNELVENAPMLNDLLNDLAAEVSSDLDVDVTVVELDTLDPDVLVSTVPKWYRTDDVVSVFCDLQNSTRLGIRQYAKSSAKTYEAATGGAVQALAAFDPEYMDIQGDGVYALFSGLRRYERAFCAGVTVRTWSETTLVPALNKKFGDRFPKTGFKVGVAASRLLGKRIGIRGTHEPVWPGKAVNYSAKLAQEAGRHEVLVTDRVYEQLKRNDYVRLSCGCGSFGVPRSLWASRFSGKLPAGEDQVYVLTSAWCGEHGDEFCAAIMEGKTKRDLPGWAA